MKMDKKWVVVLSLYIYAVAFVGIGDTNRQFSSYEEYCDAMFCSHDIPCGSPKIRLKKVCLQCRQLCLIRGGGQTVHACTGSECHADFGEFSIVPPPQVDIKITTDPDSINSTTSIPNTTTQTNSTVATDYERTTTITSSPPTTHTNPAHRFRDKCRRFCIKNKKCSMYKRDEAKTARLECEEYCEEFTSSTSSDNNKSTQASKSTTATSVPSTRV